MSQLIKRFLILFFSAAILTALVQGLRWHHLQKQRNELVARITAATSALNTKTKAPPRLGGPDRSTDASASATADARPVGLEEFFDLAGAISSLEGKSGDSSRRQIQAMVQELFLRLSVTPTDQLLVIMDRLADDRVSPQGQRQVASLIMELLARIDPSAAANHALQSSAGTHGLEVALRAWSRHDAAGAAAWLERSEAKGLLPATVEPDALRQVLLPQLLVADPTSDVASRLASVPAGELDSVLAETARLLTTEEQRRAIFQRLAAMPNQSEAVAETLVRQVGRESSVATAMAMLTQSGLDLSPSRFNSLAATAATARIDSATPAHADWLLQNLRGTERAPAITRFIEAWTQADFNATAGWLRDRPSSPDQDVAIAAFAPSVAVTEPPSAVDWATTISDPSRRQDVLRNIYDSWQARSPEDAARYFAEKGLPVPGAP